MDQKMLRIAVLLLLLMGTHEKEIFNEFQEQVAQAKPDPRKKVTTQTYIRATTEEEFIEIERTDEDGEKSYNVEAQLEPFVVTQTIKEIVKDGSNDVKITLKLKNTKIDGISKFKITGTSKKDKEKGADITFDLPEAVQLHCEYSLSGTAAKRKLQGAGTIDLEIKGAVVRGKVQVTDDGMELIIQDLNLAYDFKDIEINVTGLQIEDMNQNETNEFAHQLARKYLRINSEDIGRRLAEDVKMRLNRKLKGISTTKVISMLKNP